MPYHRSDCVSVVIDVKVIRFECATSPSPKLCGSPRPPRLRVTNKPHL